MWKQLVGISVLSLIVFATPARADRGDLDAAIDTADRAIEAIEQAAESKSLDARARATIRAQLDILRGLYAKHDDSMLLRRLAIGLTNAIQAFHTTAPQAQRVLRLELRALVSAHATDEMHIWFAINLIAEYARSLEDAGNIANAALIEEEILEVIEAIESDAAQGLLRDGLSLAYARAHHLLTKRNEPRASERLVSRMRQLATQAAATEVQRDRWSVVLMNEVLRLVAQRNFVGADSIQGEMHELTERADVTDRQLASRSYAWMIQARAHWNAGEVDVGDRWANKLWAFVESDSADRETYYLAAQMLDNQHWYARRREEAPARALALNRLRALVDRPDSAQDFVGSAKFRTPHSRLLLVLSREHRALRKAKSHVAADAILKEMRRAIKTPHEVVLLRARVDKHKLLGDEKKYDLVEPVLQMIRQTANGQSPAHRDLLARALAHAVWDIARQGRSGSADELIEELRGLTREHDTTSQQRARLIDALRGVLYVDLPRNERDALRDEAAILGQEPGSKARVQFARLLEGQTTKLLTAKQFVQAAVYMDALVAMNEADTATQKERASMLRALRVQINALEKAQRTDDVVVALARARTITHSAQAGALDRETWAHILSLRVWRKQDRKEPTNDILGELRKLANHPTATADTKLSFYAAIPDAIREILKGSRAGDTEALLTELRNGVESEDAPAAWRDQLVKGLAWHFDKSVQTRSATRQIYLEEARKVCARKGTTAQTRSWFAYMLCSAYIMALKDRSLRHANVLLAELNNEANREDAIPHTQLLFARALSNGVWYAGEREDFETALEFSEQLNALAASRLGSAEIRALLAPAMQTRHEFLVAADLFADAFVVLGQLRMLASQPSATQADRDALAGALAHEVKSVFKRGGKPPEAQRLMTDLWRLATADTATEDTRDELAAGITEIHRAALDRAAASDSMERADIARSEMRRLATRAASTDNQRDRYAEVLRAQHSYHIAASEDDRAIEVLPHLESLAVDPKRSSEMQRDNWQACLEKHLTRGEAVSGAALSSFETFAREVDFPVVKRHKLLAGAVELAYANQRDGAEDAYDVLHDLGLGKHATVAGRMVHELWLVGAIHRARLAKVQTLSKRIEADLRKAIATGIGQKIVKAMKTALEDTAD